MDRPRRSLGGFIDIALPKKEGNMITDRKFAPLAWQVEGSSL